MATCKRTEIKELLEAIDNGPELGNSWEVNFLESCMSQFKAEGTLSPKQIAKLEEIAKRIGV